jgi:glycerate 2-kinase
MKIIVAPDKFKGSLTSFEVCDAIQKGIHEADKDANVLPYPMADGGDGFAAIMKHYLGTTTVHCNTKDPLLRNIKASYEWNESGKTAIIEMAVASGLVLLSEEQRNPMKASTYGTGILVKDAIDKGARKIILGLGGSATNDAGTGILAALGFRLMDDKNNELLPSGENLLLIHKIIPPSSLSHLSWQIACDVKNTLYGANGAAYVYGPQKGATDKQVEQLDKGLQHFATVIRRETGKDVAHIPGAGAAGGIAAGLMSFFDVTLASGIQMVIDASSIVQAMDDADLVLTGEGKIDEQSKEGKVVSVIAALAHQKQIPVIAICGNADTTEQLLKKLKLSEIKTVRSLVASDKEAMENAGEFVRRIATQLAKRSKERRS